MLQGGYVTLGDIVHISMVVEGSNMDIWKVIVLFSTSNLRVNVALYCLQVGCYSSVNIGHIEGGCLSFY